MRDIIVSQGGHAAVYRVQYPDSLMKVWKFKSFLDGAVGKNACHHDRITVT